MTNKTMFGHKKQYWIILSFKYRSKLAKIQQNND